jgi:hypothetical protein
MGDRDPKDCLNCGMCESCIDRSIAAAEDARADEILEGWVMGVGTVHGPERCPVAPAGCEACSGYHHWIDCGSDPDEPVDPENDPPGEGAVREFDRLNGTEHLMAYLACKHCDAWAEYDPDGGES